MDTLSTIVGDYQAFLQTIIGKVEAAGFDMADFSQLDHMGYRASSLENYHQKKQQLDQTCTLLDEVTINDRPVAVYRLGTPIFCGKWRIDALELLSPRPGNPKPEGLDHIEFVLFDSTESFLKKYTGKDFNIEAVNRGVNPEIKYALDDHYGVKFHLLSVTAAVYLQKKLDLNNIK